MSKELVKELFGANAAKYVVSDVHAKGASLARLVELVGPQADWVGLDIATGGGHTALVFAPHVKQMIASDLTQQMLDQVEKQVAEKGIGNVETKIADAEALPFEDGSLDLVTCRIAPHHFPDIPKFVSEVCRVLKSGGTFALVDNAAPDEATNPDFGAAELAEAAVTYNTFEKIRDPSHGRAWTTSEWSPGATRPVTSTAKGPNPPTWVHSSSPSRKTRLVCSSTASVHWHTARRVCGPKL